MDVNQVKKYIGKKVLLILRNNYKFTTTIPFFENSSFEIEDKYGQKALIECEYISMIYEKEHDWRGQ